MEDPFFSDREGVGKDAQKKVEDARQTVEDDAVREPPDWLPDGWIWEVRIGDDGEHYEYYICPVSGAEFRMKAEVLNYLFSEMDEQYVESMEAAAAHGMLHKTHDWLPQGWLLEIRLGGENMDKMYKFYVYPALAVRLFSKEDVLLYVKEMKISKCDTNGQCDTSSRENILAEVDFNPYGLPPGWVKEVVFRKSKEGTNGGMRKDPYYTDPISHYTFRSLKSAVRYLETKERPKLSFIQKSSVHEVYNFEKFADLHESLRKRLLPKGGKSDMTTASSSKSTLSSRGVKINYHEKTLYGSESIDTSTDSVSPNEHKELKKKSMKTTRKETDSSKTIKRPRGRPPKVAKQTGGDTNGRDHHI
ncbi:hypothetical protein ZWY2020_005429 [Hordeum vulgare]|nr:hypothetical protein ZWY2020_005429 [Hordeum vulgare]